MPRSHSKRSIAHKGSICSPMKSTPSLMRLCSDAQVRLYRIYFGENGRRSTFGLSVDSVTFSTSKDCRVGWDFEQLPAFCRQEFCGGWGEIRKVDRWPVCCAMGISVALEGGLQSCRSPHACRRGRRWMQRDRKRAAKRQSSLTSGGK